MTQDQYDKFKATVEKKGYKQCNVPRTISNESFYYYKGFAYTEIDGEREPGYQIIFLVWDRREYIKLTGYSELIGEDTFGVTPLILTESHEWPRIDLEITVNNFDVETLEQYAHDFYYNFVLNH